MVFYMLAIATEITLSVMSFNVRTTLPLDNSTDTQAVSVYKHYKLNDIPLSPPGDWELEVKSDRAKCTAQVGMSYRLYSCVAWASWRLKLSTTQLFVQQRVQANSKQRGYGFPRKWPVDYKGSVTLQTQNVKKHVIITSKRRFDVMITRLLRCVCWDCGQCLHGMAL